MQEELKSKKKETKELEKIIKKQEKPAGKISLLEASISSEVKKRNALEKRLNETKSFNDLKEQESKLQQQNEEDRAIIEDENTSQPEKDAAEERIAERNEELARLQTQIAEREASMPLRERIKEIFKKNGFTVASIFIAAGVTIGAVIGAMTNALKKLGTDLGNGLKALGAKAASALPALIGAIVSFLFKAAGSAIGFLAEHTWLLHGTKNWIYSKFDLDQKSRSNTIIPLIQTWTRVKCVSKMLWLCFYIRSLTKKRANVILTLTPPLTHVKGGIKYLMSLPCI